MKKIIAFKNKYRIPVFIVSFFVLFFLLYRLLYIKSIEEIIHSKIIFINAYLPFAIIKLFGEPVSFLYNSTIVASNFSLKVIIDCCAIEPMVIFLAGVISYPAQVKQKLQGLLIVIPLFFIINILRIVSLYFSGAYVNLQFMGRMHLDIWQGVFILFSVALFALWINRLNVSSNQAQNVD